jgi:hypothetical protein
MPQVPLGTSLTVVTVSHDGVESRPARESSGTISALQDQAVAGVIMWRSGAAVFLVTAVWLVVDALAHADRRAPPALAEDERSLATIAEEAQEEEEEVDEVEVEG